MAKSIKVSQEVLEAMGKPHALVIPFPAQGHVIPLMELSHCLVEQGFDITFVDSDFIHGRVVAAFPDINNEDHPIRLVSIPDGMALGEDRNDVVKLIDSILAAMPGHLEELIGKIIRSGDKNKITCVIADVFMGWALEVAEKFEIRGAAFWPMAAGYLASVHHIPRLIESEIINEEGFPTERPMIRLSSTMPAIDANLLAWCRISELKVQRAIFRFTVQNYQSIKDTNLFICNSFYELESWAYPLVPKLLPLGPLLSDDTRAGQPVGNFWLEDLTCLSWLDQQLACSVIYVAFGSFTIIDHSQFCELALGLELLCRPFLWVVRSDLTSPIDGPYPDGFRARVAARGRIVSWSPQKKVLAHPSVSCFLTHCGWNSTMEALSMGVPLLTWPCFIDQFLNQSYISDVWKIGLELKPNANGFISREEIKNKVEELVSDEGIRERASEMKKMARKSVSDGGSTSKNFNAFVEVMKQ